MLKSQCMQSLPADNQLIVGRVRTTLEPVQCTSVVPEPTDDKLIVSQQRPYKGLLEIPVQSTLPHVQFTVGWKPAPK